MSLDPLVVVVLRGSLGLLLVVAAGHKLRGPREFAQTLGEYRLLPRAAVGLAARLVPWLELCAAGALLLPGAGGPLAVAVLLAAYSGAIAVNLARGRRHIDCGCGGPGAGRTLSGGLLLRNAVLIAAAALCLLPAGARPLQAIDVFTVVVGTGALAALYASTDRLLAQAPVSARLRSVT